MAALVLSGCADDLTGPCRFEPGSGRLVTEARPVGGFDAIAVSSAGQLIVEQAGVESLEITAEDNVLPFVVSDVRNGRLSLGFATGGGVAATRPVVYRVGVKRLNWIEASGASQVEVSGVDGEHLRLDLSGASSVTARGRVRWLELRASGASRLRARELRSRLATAALSGASHGLLRVDERLEASLSGISILEYLGDPVVSSDVSGGSFVRRVGP
jgi:hypothetical protein